MMVKRLIQSRKVQILIIAVILIGIIPLATKPLKFGMDFTGGSLINVKLERSLEKTEIEPVVAVLQNRLNIYGLKEVSVKPAGNEFIVIEIAETDPEAVNEIQALLAEQGRFETLFNGEVVLTGEDIVNVITDPQKNYGVYQAADGYNWIAPFLLSNEGSYKFAEAVEGQCTQIVGTDRCAELVYMFIDRPQNAVILMSKDMYDSERNVPNDFVSSASTISIEELIENSGVELIVSDTLTDEVLAKVEGKKVIIAEGVYDVDLLGQHAEEVVVRQQLGEYWIQSALNIENIVHLTPGVTSGAPVTEPSITGYAATEEVAREELNRVVILLKSGKLPVSVAVGGVSTISPTLGTNFLQYSMFAGLAAILTVSAVLFIRYREIRIALPIILTSLSEIIMILGIAALIGWQIDLPAVAGIIAAVGTGVDHQIIISDELLRKEQEVELSKVRRIKKAFSIIFMAAATTIVAMLPLLSMGLGVLKGFAITTILGSLIGVFIARPAFADIVGKLMRK